jgi:N-acetylmuramic acid 6-phosphate (MurNAc-6-P) etherase
MEEPFTERQNAHTARLGRGASPQGIVRALRSSDAQLFSGFAGAEEHDHRSSSPGENTAAFVGAPESVGDPGVTAEIASVSAKIAHVIDRSREILERNEGLSLDNKEDEERVVVLMTGCGTSGRIAFLAARHFSRRIRQQEPELKSVLFFRYCISGGDASLILSQELPEDDPQLGVADMNRIRGEYPEKGTHFVLFGITCGLSAPYVLGQTDAVLKEYEAEQSRSDHSGSSTVVLVGFNPPGLARSAPVEKWGSRTCRDAALAVFGSADRDRAAGIAAEKRGSFVLNPSVGPESVTGSSRMKGGSMTKLLLETVFGTALCLLSPRGSHDTAGIGVPEPATAVVSAIFESFSEVCCRTYWSSPAIAEAMSMAGDSLRHDRGHIYYLGSNDTTGIVGFIDASEMYDTYGERADKVRGFVEGGWATAEINDQDISSVDDMCRISLDDFRRAVRPTVCEFDTLVVPAFLPPGVGAAEFCSRESRFREAVELRAQTGCKVVYAFFGDAGVNEDAGGADVSAQCDVAIRVALGSGYRSDHPQLGVSAPILLAEFAAKLTFNALTTGASVLKGRVFGNYMINLGVSNNKLFHRSCRTIALLMGTTLEEAREALLCAIYEVDETTPDIRANSISHTVTVATPKPWVLPVALLLVSGSCAKFSEAREALRKNPVVHHVIQEAESR